MNSKTSKIVAWLGTGPNGGADVVTTNEIQVREWKRLGLTIIPLVEQPAELAEQQGVEQPPLPRTHYNACGDGSEPLYTAEQMQDYARAALAATGKQQVDPAWSLHDRVEFALRDAGFDFDEASRIALQVDGKQQVGEVQGDGRAKWLEVRGLAAGIVKNLEAFAASPHKAAWCGALDDSLSFADQIEKDAAAAIAARQPGAQEPITVEAVATIERDSDGDRYVSFLLEGGISELEVGDVLMVADRSITDDDGSGEVYAAPPAQGIDLGQLQLYRMASGPGGVRNLYKDDTGSWVKIQDVERLIGQRDAAPGVGNG